MAVILPSTINADEATGLPKYSAEVMRLNMGASFTLAQPGLVRTGAIGAEPEVSLDGSTVQVGPFPCVIGTAKGAYITGLDSITTAGTVDVADPTNPRRDRIILQVLDPDNGGAAATRNGVLRIVRGEPAPLPGLPPLPSNSLPIGEIYVPRAGTGAPTLTRNCPLTSAAGAPVPVRNEDERASIVPRAGQLVQRLDRAGALEVGFDGAWGQVTKQMRDGYTTVRTDGSGQCTITYDHPFPRTTTIAVPVSMAPPSGMALIRFVSGNRTGATFLVTATNGGLLANVAVGIGYIATGF